MELERDVLGSPAQEVPVVEGAVILAIRALADCGVGSKVTTLAQSLEHPETRMEATEALRGSSTASS